MTTTQRRIALLTGAAVSAFGVAAPAYAATTTTPSITDITFAPDVSNFLTICLSGSTCDPGVNATGSGIVNAFVFQGIVQAGIATAAGPTNGYVTLTATNAGHAIAHATAVASGIGAQVANAKMQTGVAQIGQGSDVHVRLVNHASATLGANVSAQAFGATANANALLEAGIGQAARGGTQSGIAEFHERRFGLERRRRACHRKSCRERESNKFRGVSPGSIRPNRRRKHAKQWRHDG